MIPRSALRIFVLFAASKANGQNVRFFFCYGDQQTVEFAREAGDTTAALGREIPVQLPFRVPINTLNNGKFKVQFWQEYVTGGAPWLRDGSNAFNFSYDRTLSGDTEWNPMLDSSSFRKLTYAYEDRAACFTNPGNFLGWKQNGDIFDANNDGVQDVTTISIGGVRTYGSSGAGVTVRPIGLGGGTTADAFGFSASIHSLKNVPQRLFDVEFRALMVQGETYGFGGGETGLAIRCDSVAPPGPSANFFYPSAGITFTGAKYNLVAVPEPSGFLIVGLGLLYLRRSHRKPRN